VAKTKGNLAKE